MTAEQEQIQQQVKQIKQSFRLIMDGKIASSMREKGVNYKLNWGASLPFLKEMAQKITNVQSTTDKHLYNLAIALWKEDVRECKILATMLMPAEEMLPEVCDIWMEQIPTQEVAEQASLNLWQHLPYAPQKAYEWIASDREVYQLCGFHVLSRLFMNGQEPNERGINEYIDQLTTALQGSSIAVRKAAYQSVQRFANLGLVYERMAKSALKNVNLDIF